MSAARTLVRLMHVPPQFFGLLLVSVGLCACDPAPAPATANVAAGEVSTGGALSLRGSSPTTPCCSASS